MAWRLTLRSAHLVSCLQVLDSALVTAAALSFEANTYNYSAVVADTVDGLYLRWTGAASSSSQSLLGVKNLTGSHCAGGSLTLVNGQPLYGAVSLDYATCRTVTIRVQAHGAATGSTAVRLDPSARGIATRSRPKPSRSKMVL
jgi:hypothetical protein